MAKWTKSVLRIFKYITKKNYVTIVEAEFYFFLLHFHFAVKWVHENGSDQRARGEQDKCQIQAKAKEKKAEIF